MKKYIVLAMSCMLLLSACDSHIPFPDTGIKVGSVLCSDGSITDTASVRRSGKTPVAVVFHVNHDTAVDGFGYAVYLHNLAAAAFADSLGVAQGTSASLTSQSGNADTYALLVNETVSSPIALQVFSIWYYGQSAYVPSVAELRLLNNAVYDVNPYITAMGGDALDCSGNCWLWSSTEVQGHESLQAWLYAVGSGEIQETPKDGCYPTRPIICLRY